MSSTGGIRAGKAFVEFFADKSPFVRELRAMEKDFKAFGANLMKAGTAIASVGTIVSSAFAGASLAFSNFAFETQKQADKLGLTVEQYQALGFAAQQTGKEIGELVELFKAGELDIEAFSKRAEELGIIMSGEDVSAGRLLAQTFSELNSTISALWRKIGAALAPTLTDLGKQLTTVIMGAVEWVDTNRELIVTVAKFTAGIAAAGGVLVAAGAAIAGIGTALGLLLTPMGAVAAGTVTLGGAFLTMTDTGKRTTSLLVESFTAMADSIKELWRGIGDALSAGDLALAGRIAFEALTVAWVDATNIIKSIWRGVTSWILDAWDTTVAGFSGILIDGLSGMEKAWIGVTDLFMDAWDGAWSAMYRGAAEVIGAVFKQLTSLAELIADVTGYDLTESVAKLGEDLQRGSGAIADQTDARIMNREQNRNERLTGIEADRVSSRDTIAEDLNRKLMARQLKNQSAADLADGELNAAKAKYAASLKEAADKRQALIDAGNGITDSPAIAAVTTGGNDMQARADAVREQLARAGDMRRASLAALENMKVTTTGTFSGAAAGKLGASDPMLRENQEQTRLLRQIATGGLKFS